jgi:hypothetical protein
MLRRNPDVLALLAIVLFVLAAKAPVPAPARAVMTPIRVEMLAQRDCLRAEMQAQREEIRRTIKDSVRDVTDSLPFE